MITAVRLQNFQKHADLSLNFGEGVTLITGPTNAGKSSVFRAISWVVLHTPMTGYQKHGTKTLRVGVRTQRGAAIRFKDSKGYGYTVGEEKFVACGTNQPPAVREALGLSEINLASQHSGFFLLNLTPGEMAKSLNKIVDLASIDVGTAEITRKLTRAKAAAEIAEDRKVKATAAEAETAWMDVAIETGMQLANRLGLYEDGRKRHELLLQDWSDYQAVREQLMDAQVIRMQLKELCDSNFAVQTAKSRLVPIRLCVTDLKSANSDMLCLAIPALASIVEQIAAQRARTAKSTYVKNTVRELREIPDLSGASVVLGSTLLAKQQRLTSLIIARAELSQLVHQVKDVAASLETQSALKAAVEKQLGNICTLCKRPL